MVDLSLGTILMQFVNFIILVAILAKFAYKPLLNLMQERKDRIANDLETAEEARLNAEALKLDYEKQITSARKEAQEIIEKATKEAELNAQKQLNEVRQQIANEKERAQADIVREREKAMAKIHEEVVSLSLALASKVVEKNLDSDTNSRLIKDAIDKLDNKSIGL